MTTYRTLPETAFVAALDGKMLYYARQFEPAKITREHFERLFGREPAEVITVGQWNYCPLRGAESRGVEIDK